jgi:nitrile hydratase subunit alpha
VTGHPHDHDSIEHGGEPAVAARARALEELLVERGVIDRHHVRQRIDWLVSRSPADGARLVARAWVDP